MHDAAVLAYLRRRWVRPLDLTTIGQAQAALALPRSTAQRIRLYRELDRDTNQWRRIRRYGAGPVTVTLTEAEKLLARRMLRGDSFTAAARALHLAESDARAAGRTLRAVGFLQRGRPPAAPAPFLDGVGLQAHTVRVEGEPAFNVP